MIQGASKGMVEIMPKNIIVTEQNHVIRGISRKELSGNWIKVTLGVALYFLLSVIIPLFMESFVKIGRTTQYIESTGQTVNVSTLSTLYQFFLTGAFMFGLCSFFIAFFRRKDINPGYIFNGFEYYTKTFLLMIVMGALIFLQLLLLIVPGIIAAYRYSQAFYIMADDPTKGPMQCIQESKFMMNGNKMKLFLLELSFIGWIILAAIPLCFISAYTVTHSLTSGLLFLLNVVGYIPLVFLQVYMGIAKTVFYDLLSGHLIVNHQSIV